MKVELPIIKIGKIFAAWEVYLMNDTNFGSCLRPYHPYSWWIPCEEQVKTVKKFLDKFGGDKGFTSNDVPPPPDCFAKITIFQERHEYGELITTVKRGAVSDIYNQMLMLTVILPYNNKQRSIQRSFNSWLRFISISNGYKVPEHDYMKSDYDHLKLYGGVENKPGIYWVWFDPSANYNVSPKSCRRNKSILPFLANVHNLIAMALFPEWPNSWDGSEDAPYPMFSGYEAYFKTWKNVPCFIPPQSQDDIERKLCLTPHDSLIKGCSSPIVIDYDANKFFVP